MAIYIDRYPIGYEIVERTGSSLERWPISEGPYTSYEEAQAAAAAAGYDDEENN